MLARGILVVCIAASLSGCGQARKDDGEAPQDNEGSFASGFNQSYDRSFVDSCVSSATGRGVSDEIASQVCNCAIAEINDKYSTLEKARLSDDQLGAAMKKCTDKVKKTDG